MSGGQESGQKVKGPMLFRVSLASEPWTAPRAFRWFFSSDSWDHSVPWSSRWNYLVGFLGFFLLQIVHCDQE